MENQESHSTSKSSLEKAAIEIRNSYDLTIREIAKKHQVRCRRLYRFVKKQKMQNGLLVRNSSVNVISIDKFLLFLQCAPKGLRFAET